MADTISDKLTRLNEVKQSIKQSIIDKGVQVADTDTFRSYADKIGQIQAGGGEPATKFGASVSTWLGDVDENGVLNRTTWTGALNFAGVKEIGDRAFLYMFRDLTGITGVDLSSVITIGLSSFETAFYGCTGITSVDLSSLQSVGNYGLSNAFYGCTGITSFDLSSLQSVGTNGLSRVFFNCTGITTVDLSSLQSVGVGGLQYAFNGCKKLTTMSFPSLTSVQSNSLSNAFSSCSALTEIHFRADMQATIEALTGYSSKFGATKATIYFSL
jgi:hypothetical protein